MKRESYLRLMTTKWRVYPRYSFRIVNKKDESLYVDNNNGQPTLADILASAMGKKPTKQVDTTKLCRCAKNFYTLRDAKDYLRENKLDKAGFRVQRYRIN